MGHVPNASWLRELIVVLRIAALPSIALRRRNAVYSYCYDSPHRLRPCALSATLTVSSCNSLSSFSSLLEGFEWRQ